MVTRTLIYLTMLLFPGYAKKRRDKWEEDRIAVAEHNAWLAMVEADSLIEMEVQRKEKEKQDERDRVLRELKPLLDKEWEKTMIKRGLL